MKSLQTQGKILTSNFLLVWLTTFTAFGSFHLLWAVLPLYVLNIGGTTAETGIIVGAFAAASVIARPFVGQASDLRGEKVLLLAAAATIFGATLLYNVSHTVVSLLVVRVMYGLGWGAFSTISVTLAVDIAPERRRGEAVGYFGMASLISMAGWPAVGVFLQEAYGFPIVLYATTFVALLCLVTALPVSEPRAKKADGPATRQYALSHLFERSALSISVIGGLLFLSQASINGSK